MAFITTALDKILRALQFAYEAHKRVEAIQLCAQLASVVMNLVVDRVDFNTMHWFIQSKNNTHIKTGRCNKLQQNEI